MPHRRAINIGQIPHHFAINTVLIKVIRIKLPQFGDKILIKIPRVGMQLMIKYPTYAPPLWGLTLIGALPSRVCNVCVNMFTYTNIDLHAYIIKLGPQ
jgi:hypothetical protein